MFVHTIEQISEMEGDGGEGEFKVCPIFEPCFAYFNRRL